MQRALVWRHGHHPGSAAAWVAAAAACAAVTLLAMPARPADVDTPAPPGATGGHAADEAPRPSTRPRPDAAPRTGEHATAVAQPLQGTAPALAGDLPALLDAAAADATHIVAGQPKAAGPAAGIVAAAGIQPNGIEHAASSFGITRYPAGFHHFDWVNPDAPKGGRMVMGLVGTFDSLNPLIGRGQVAPGLSALGPANWVYDRLLVASADDATAAYGLLAEGVRIDESTRTVTFHLRAGARWHDGVPIIAGDVVFAFETIQRVGSPVLKTLFNGIDGATALDAHTVRFQVSPGIARMRAAALVLGELFPLPRHWWAGRDPSRALLEAPLGSGPYRVGEIRAPRAIEYERVPDYWGRDLPVNRGRHNFDRLRYEHFRDYWVQQESLRGGLFDAGEEGAARMWETQYAIPSVRDGVLRRDLFPLETPSGPGVVTFALNARRPPLDDVRVREALAQLRDFDWAQRVLYWGDYARVDSHFGGTPFAHQGQLPSDDELRLLEPLRGRIPERVFTQPFTTPRSSAIGHERQYLAAANRLLDAAGLRVVDGWRIDPRSGRRLRFDMMLSSPSHQRILETYRARLARAGIDSTVRYREPSQFIARLGDFDYDIAIVKWDQPFVPDADLPMRFGSASAAIRRGGNWAGVRDGAIDLLIGHATAAQSMPEAVAAIRALDRVLLWNFHYVTGFWQKRIRWVWWDRFGMPDVRPEYRTGFPDAWWFDAARSARVDAWRGRQRRH
jgi:microcin C transport system substrate-binding protein